MPRKIASLPLVSLLCLMLVGSPARAVEPLYVPAPIEIPAGKSAEQVKLAIRKALVRRTWVMREYAPGHLQGRRAKPGRHGAEHIVIVDIRLDAGSVRIGYNASQAMSYDKDEGTIHSTYNEWVRALEKDIRDNLAGS